jgi:hypothetical protein
MIQNLSPYLFSILVLFKRIMLAVFCVYKLKIFSYEIFYIAISFSEIIIKKSNDFRNNYFNLNKIFKKVQDGNSIDKIVFHEFYLKTSRVCVSLFPIIYKDENRL